MHIVLLETSGNQTFIFGTNRLRENVGASEMIYRVGTRFVLDAVDRIRGGQLGRFWNQSRQLAGALTSETENPPIESGRTAVEVIVAASGKAILLVESEEVGRRVIQDVTRRALVETPGVTLHGVVISDAFSFDRDPDEQFRDVHVRHAVLRNELPANEARFARLPVVASCATSGLPAAEHDRNAPGDSRGEPRSLVSKIKRIIGNDRETFSRMKRMAGGVELAKNFEILEKRFEDLEWLAVVHADGNGLGKIFQAFGMHTGTSSDVRGYLNAMRRFSLALDLCTQQAFAAAIKDWYLAMRPNQTIVPIVPLVLGGDDMTIVCDGKMAVQFAVRFLEEFERATREDCYGEQLTHLNGTIGRISAGGLSACAGVAVVKPHFPFHAAYELAESLLANAKQVKLRANGCSAVDFYVHNMSSNVGLEAIRDELESSDGTVLYGGPYVTTPQERVGELDDNLLRWLSDHRWEHVERQVTLLRERDPNDPSQRLLPNSLMHRVRAKLHDGHQAAQDYMDHVKERYRDLQRLCADGNGLFWDSERDKKKCRQTRLLDAMSLVDLWLDEREARAEADEEA